MTGFLDHAPGRTLRDALHAAAPPVPTAQGLAEAPTTLAELALATGLISPAGFGAIADSLDRAGHVRLLLAAEPPPEAERPRRLPGDPPPAVFAAREVRTALERQDEALRELRDRTPFTPAGRAHLHRLAAMLHDRRLEVRRHERAFLHARAVLLDGFETGVLLGSANLTETALDGRLDLALGRWDPAVLAQARAWFDALWAEAVPFDLARLFAEPDAEYPPWLIFLRMLLALYGEDLPDAPPPEPDAVGIPLLEFQRHGVLRAKRILAEHGGVLIADEVGLGKTFIAGALLEECAARKQRALLICPAALRDTTWAKFLNTHGFSRRVASASYDQLARDPRLGGTGAHAFDADLEDIALVVVDEAHNYRSPDAPARAEVLKRLLGGGGRDLVLMTATPVNNSLWDLHTLLRYFLRGDGALAAQGVPKLRERFSQAARTDPAALDPDLLFPVIDAVTVKRTRAFIRRYYPNTMLPGADGTLKPVVFPKAVPIDVRYTLDAGAPEVFDAVAAALDPEGGDAALSFARYGAARWRLRRDADDAEAGETAAGLLRSGLLKRFESSTHAFRLSLQRMRRDGGVFLEALARGRVLTTALLREASADETALEGVLDAPTGGADAVEFDVPALRAAVEHDDAILGALLDRLAAIAEEADPKLHAVADALAAIAAEARADAATDADERRNRKVLLFSYFGETVEWLRRALAHRIEQDPRLAAYRGRIAAVAGRPLDGEDASRNGAVYGFAPESGDAPAGTPDRYDLLLATDVLAEGLNLQQCRHVLNYDLPWNPMRLVQRHGRIDRIGSPHRRVFLRTVFPVDRLEGLLALEERIMAKLAQAARSIGVATPPVQTALIGKQHFAGTRGEIERLLAGDATLFEQRGGAPSGEEYRHRLRAALLTDRDTIVRLAGGAGSAVRRGAAQGIVFCAEVPLRGGRRTFLRFVPTDAAWRADGPIVRELATCLRLADAEREEPRADPGGAAHAAFALWEAARADILAECDDLGDPATLQPQVARLNREVAAWLRAQRPPDIAPEALNRALDVLETPWPRPEEAQLRLRFQDTAEPPPRRAAALARWVLETGLQPATPPPRLPTILADDVRLLCWQALLPA